MRILIVDDDPIIRELLPTILRQEGYTDISVVASGNAALDILGRLNSTFDVLILDIAMLEMDGVELCTRVRKIPAYRTTPIIMLTAKSDALSIESAFVAGATDYITKPFDVKRIGLRIQIADRTMRKTCKTVTQDSLTNRLPEPFETEDLGIKDAVRISGLAQHTDPFSLGNYLSQLARKMVTETSVFAAKIGAFEPLHEIYSSRELLLIIAEASTAISVAVGNKRLLGAYLGSGTFMCIAANDILGIWLAMEHRVAEYLKHSERLQTAGINEEISVTMGRPFRPNASKTKRVRPTFERAILQLDRRNKVSNKAN